MIRVEFTTPEGVRWEPQNLSGSGVLVLAGSSGRVDDQRARVFADLGCIAESIRWFGGPGQHSGPWEIPLETFFDRLESLGNDCDRVYVAGTSFGAEAALLCGAYSNAVDGVIAFAPSDVVWAGYDSTGTATSHWTLGGDLLPYVPLDPSAHNEESPPRYRPLYEASRELSADRVHAATIPVEQIGDLLLVVGGDDQVWPSRAHARRISQRRAAEGLTTTIVEDAEAGHRAVLPGENVVVGGMNMQRGGTEVADRRLGRRAWDIITKMLLSSR